MTKFIPGPSRIHFEPIQEKKGVFKGQDGDVIESGKVIAVGEGVTFVKPGDVVNFLRWGAEETPEGNWSLRAEPAFIMGKLIEEND